MSLAAGRSAGKVFPPRPRLR